VRNTLKDSAVADKLEAGDKDRLERLVNETIDWLDHNQVGAGGCWAAARAGRGVCWRQCMPASSY
jgi:hypothetical protein